MSYVHMLVSCILIWVEIAHPKGNAKNSRWIDNDERMLMSAPQLWGIKCHYETIKKQILLKKCQQQMKFCSRFWGMSNI